MHTKGPWECHEGEGHDNPPLIVSSELGCICVLEKNPNGIDDIANGALIAAAPDMYEVLKAIDASQAALPAKVWNQLWKALAKAEAKS